MSLIQSFDCNLDLANNFIRNCYHKPKAGILNKWIGLVDGVDTEATDLNLTPNNEIDLDSNYGVNQFVIKSGYYLYKVEGNDKTHKAKHAFSENDFDEGYIHTDTITFLDRNKVVRENIGRLSSSKRFFTISEMVDKASDGSTTFQIAGLFSGMKLINDDYDSAENSGTQTVVLETKEQELEPTGILDFLLTIPEGYTGDAANRMEYTKEKIEEMVYII